MRKLLPFIFLLAVLPALAQKPLSNSRKSGYYTYVYRLDAAGIKHFYSPQGKTDTLDDHFLHNPVDSALTDHPLDFSLPPGNYLQVVAKENKLSYRLVENRSAYLKLMEDTRNIRFILLDVHNQEIKEASVFSGSKAIAFNREQGMYITKKRKADTLIRVSYAGVDNYYRINTPRPYYYGGSQRHYTFSQWMRARWYALKRPFKRWMARLHPKPYINKYAPPVTNMGYMVFNKPKYRDGDTVKFKAFILDKQKKPISDKRVLVRLKDQMWDNGKIIGYIDAYRPGAFEYQFKITDSLDLDLDNDYFISLESLESKQYDLDNYHGNLREEQYLAKRKVYQQEKFHYEDYELTTNSYNFRMDKEQYYPGSPIAMYFKATDDNGLNVTDGRVELTIRSQNTYNFRNQHDFVPDTIWKHTLQLDAVGETRLDIPDSIFHKADMECEVYARFLNSNNEGQTLEKSFKYAYDNRRLQLKLDADTLKADYLVGTKSMPMMANLISLRKENNDTVEVKKVQLPTSIVINPATVTYTLETDSVAEDLNMHDYQVDINISGYRTRDSMFINVNNPRHLHFWYTIFAGNSIFEQGTGNELNKKWLFRHSESVSVLINYIWAGEPQHQEIRVPYQDKFLSIDVKQPLSVYPGQQATIQVHVHDDDGRPVENADLTAYALTKKFNYTPPVIPYLGKTYGDRKFNRVSALYPLRKLDGYMQLNWQRWGREMGLDSINYYRFTHPKATWQIAEPNPDSIRQIAPFVVRNGDILPVHILYIDNIPVYFSQTEDKPRYSFRVDTGKHTLRFRTVNQDITVSNVVVPGRSKLILSVNAGATPSTEVKIKALPDTLTNYEAGLINKYMIGLVPNFDGRMATIKQGDNYQLFDRTSFSNSRNSYYMLAGPFFGSYAWFDVVGDKGNRAFEVEPGYSFQFEPGLIKQKTFRYKYPFNTNLKGFGGNTDYTQYAYTAKSIDTLWQSYLNNRGYKNNVFREREISVPAINGRLEIATGLLPSGKTALVKAVFIYRYDDPDFLVVRPGAASGLGSFGPGKYRVLFLLPNREYFLMENVMIKPNGLNFYKTGIITPQPQNEMSVRIDSVFRYHDAHTSTAYPMPSTARTDDVQIIKESFNDKYLDQSVLTGTISGTIYGKSDRLPLIGVTVKVRGTSIATATDINGRFRLRVPSSGKLQIAYIGYETKEVSIKAGQQLAVYLTEMTSALNEVVVIGYGTERRMDMTGAVSTVYAQAPGTVTVQLRGSGSIGSVKPLWIVDGVPSIGDESNLNPDQIASITVLKSEAATALYGSRAAGGAIIVTTKKNAGNLTADENGALPTLRKNFSDYAYWQPRLRSDRDGNASFKVTFPDDITNWNTYVIGMTDKRQTGMAQSQIKAFKSLSANMTAPLFAVRGDILKPIGKVLNYTPDTIRLKRTFSYNDQLLSDKNLVLKNSVIDTFKVTADGKDSLRFAYTIKRDNGYFDGEERTIPLFEQGVLETKGSFDVLEKDTTITIKLDPKLQTGTFRAEASVLPALLDETRHLRDYEYLCNEQLSSKIKGLLAERQIRKLMGEPFKYNKLVEELIKKLQDARRKEGTWGWWKDSDTELWISLHAVEALLDAETQGFATKLDKQKLIDYLLYQANSLRAYDRLTVIQMLRRLGAKADYTKLIAEYKKQITPKTYISLYDKFRLMLVEQHNGRQMQMDTLMKYSHTTMFGNMYWERESYSFFDNDVQATLLAYQLLKTDGRKPELLSKIRNYFMEQRKTGYWRNTYESAQILQALLPDWLAGAQKLQEPSITLSGAKNETITKFPYTTQLAAADVLTIKKAGSLPVYITAYQKFWNDKPERVAKDFTVNTVFVKNRDTLTHAKGGELITLQAEVIARADADYVMVEIPIPAGCSYADKSQAWGNGEVHREYFRNKVSIFCRNLSVGRHYFTVQLNARYGGIYHVNPAKAEMMYFPVFYGREGMKQFEITE